MVQWTHLPVWDKTSPYAACRQIMFRLCCTVHLLQWGPCHWSGCLCVFTGAAGHRVFSCVGHCNFGHNRFCLMSVSERAHSNSSLSPSVGEIKHGQVINKECRAVEIVYVCGVCGPSMATILWLGIVMDQCKWCSPAEGIRPPSPSPDQWVYGQHSVRQLLSSLLFSISSFVQIWKFNLSHWTMHHTRNSNGAVYDRALLKTFAFTSSLSEYTQPAVVWPMGQFMLCCSNDSVCVTDALSIDCPFCPCALGNYWRASIYIYIQ